MQNAQVDKEKSKLGDYLLIFIGVIILMTCFVIETHAEDITAKTIIAITAIWGAICMFLGFRAFYKLESLNDVTGAKKMGTQKDGTYTLWDYELRTREINWKGDEEGAKRSIYFFGKISKPDADKKGKKCGIPEGYFVGVNKRTTLPFLTKDIAKAYPGTPGVPSK